MSRLFEVTLRRTQHAKYQIYAETWEEAEDKALNIMSDTDFVTNECAGDLDSNTEEIDKVLSRYVIDTSLSAIEIYAYDLEDAIHKVKQMVKDSVVINTKGCYPLNDTEEDCE